MELLPTLLLGVLAVLSLLLLRAEGLLRRPKALFVCAVCVALAFFLRALCMEHRTLDYENFLSVWVAHFRQSGGFAGIADYRGNYNMPYLYFLALFSYLNVEPLVPIKLLSVVFDVLLAWGAERIAAHFSLSEGRRRAAFLITLLLPTVVLNGAYWGQCDSIYVALAVWSLYWMLRDRPGLSMVFLALSFAFKLQAVFFMPVYFLFLLRGKLRLRHLPLFPITYLLAVLPAAALGRPLRDTVLVYFSQAGTVGSALNYNSPSVFAFFLPENADRAGKLGILAAFLFVILVWLLVGRKARRADDRALLTAALLLVIAVPFLLPHMHDRYFFGADVLSLAAAVVLPQLAPVPLLCGFASLLGYYAYLRGRFLLPMSMGAAALVIALLWLLVELAVQLQAPAGKRLRKKT